MILNSGRRDDQVHNQVQLEVITRSRIPILNDSWNEASETFRLTLSEPDGTTLADQQITTVAIIHNDEGFQLESSKVSLAEDAGVVLLRILRGTDDTNSTVTVRYATADGSATRDLDYTPASGTLTFVPGEGSRLLPIAILNNGATDPVTDPVPTLNLDASQAGFDTFVTRCTEIQAGGAVELWAINRGSHVPPLSGEFSRRVVDWLLAHPKP